MLKQTANIGDAKKNFSAWFWIKEEFQVGDWHHSNILSVKADDYLSPKDVFMSKYWQIDMHFVTDLPKICVDQNW